MSQFIVATRLSILCLLPITGCGPITFGGSSSSSTTAVNDPAPTGTIVSRGTLTAENGQTLSGTVTIYSTENGVNVARLESYTGPKISTLQIWVKAQDSSYALQTALKGNSGNMNYSFSVVGMNLSSVEIIDTSKASGSNRYGYAPLAAVNYGN